MSTKPRRKLLVSSEARQFRSRQFGGPGVVPIGTGFCDDFFFLTNNLTISCRKLLVTSEARQFRSRQFGGPRVLVITP